MRFHFSYVHAVVSHAINFSIQWVGMDFATQSAWFHPCLRFSLILTVASNLATQALCRASTATLEAVFWHLEEVLLFQPFPFQPHVYQHCCNTLSTPDETTGAITFSHTGYTTEKQHSIKEHLGRSMLTGQQSVNSESSLSKNAFSRTEWSLAAIKQKHTTLLQTYLEHGFWKSWEISQILCK